MSLTASFSLTLRGSFSSWGLGLTTAEAGDLGSGWAMEVAGVDGVVLVGVGEVGVAVEITAEAGGPPFASSALSVGRTVGV